MTSLYGANDGVLNQLGGVESWSQKCHKVDHEQNTDVLFDKLIRINNSNKSVFPLWFTRKKLCLNTSPNCDFSLKFIAGFIDRTRTSMKHVRTVHNGSLMPRKCSMFDVLRY